MLSAGSCLPAKSFSQAWWLSVDDLAAADSISLDVDLNPAADSLRGMRKGCSCPLQSYSLWMASWEPDWVKVYSVLGMDVANDEGVAEDTLRANL